MLKFSITPELLLINLVMFTSWKSCRIVILSSTFGICMKISSRTLHIPWDDAGCLCPVGDLFNYAAPGEDALDSEESFVTDHPSSWNASSPLWNGETTEQYDVEQLDANLLRLTDGGYEEDVSAYCFYARKNYQKGEQVSVDILVSFLFIVYFYVTYLPGKLLWSSSIIHFISADLCSCGTAFALGCRFVYI